MRVYWFLDTCEPFHTSRKPMNVHCTCIDSQCGQISHQALDSNCFELITALINRERHNLVYSTNEVYVPKESDCHVLNVQCVLHTVPSQPMGLVCHSWPLILVWRPSPIDTQTHNHVYYSLHCKYLNSTEKFIDILLRFLRKKQLISKCYTMYTSLYLQLCFVAEKDFL